jgi:hypothetical protein
MKNILFSVALVFAYISNSFGQQTAHPWCGTDAIQQKLKQENPGFAEHMHKSMSKVAKRQHEVNGAQKLTLIVPVVIHVIHDNGIGNISDEQIKDGLRILNEDYNRLNSDTAATRNTATAPFQSVAGTMDIEFKLAK